MERLDHAAAIDVTTDMLDRVESHRNVGRIVHGQDDAGDDLDTQAHHEDGAEGPPVVEVLRRREVHQVLLGEPDDRQAVIEPLLDAGTGRISRMFGHRKSPH
ncbi:hypothetical protein D3C72_2141590 [compost metagenome]